jgi:spore coat polysaccharide biosynthesis protein SpsF (cytidylyltransferase family)
MEFRDQFHFAHVTSYFYENLSTLNHKLVECNIPGYDYEKYKFSVNTMKDFNRIKYILKN